MNHKTLFAALFAFVMPALNAISEREIITSLLSFLPSEERAPLEVTIEQESLSPDDSASADRLRLLRKALEQRATMELAKGTQKRTGENLHPTEQPVHSFDGVWQTLSACTLACITYLVIAAIQDESASSIIKQEDSPLRPIETHQANLRRCARASIQLASLIRDAHAKRNPV